MKKQGFVANEIELERDAQKELQNWKRTRHQTVLQVEGSRQVGKMRFEQLLPGCCILESLDIAIFIIMVRLQML